MTKNLFSFIAAFALIIAISFFWSTTSLLYQKPTILLSPHLNLLLPLIVFSLSIVAILTFTSILSLFLEQKFYAVISLLIINLPIFLFLPLQPTTLILFFTLVLVLALTFSLLQRERSQHLRFSASHQFPSHLKRLLLFISLLFSLGFYQFSASSLKNYQITLPPELEEKILNFLLSSQFPASPGSLQFPKSPNTPLSPETLSSLLPPHFLQQQFNSFITPFRPYLPAFFSISIFLTINWLSFLFVFLSILFTNIIITALKISGLLKVEKISKDAESLTL